MDGTLVDSTDGVVGAWQTFAETYPGIDVHDILSCMWYTSYIFQIFNITSIARCTHCRESPHTLWHHRSRRIRGMYASNNLLQEGSDMIELLERSHPFRTRNRKFCLKGWPQGNRRSAWCPCNHGWGMSSQWKYSSKQADLFNHKIGPASKLPNPRWGICTSATKNYATAALKAAGIAIPDVFVVSEDVEKGKPE